jgi:predicted nucleic acid-binding protein
MKILIDTPIWSKALRRRKIISDDKNIVDNLKEKMNGFNDFPIGTADYELAAEYSNICRKNGIRGSNTDFLICALAVRNNFEIFTTDGDFNQYKKYLPIKLFASKFKVAVPKFDILEQPLKTKDLFKN